MAKGKPGSSPLMRPDADAVSLHSQHRGYVGPEEEGSSGGNRHAFIDADDDAPELFLDGDDMPPLYTDVVSGNVDDLSVTADGAVAGAGSGAGSGTAGTTPGSLRSNAGAPGVGGFRYPTTVAGEPKPWRYDIGPFNSTDATRLSAVVKAWAAIPPRPFVQLRGTHSQTVDRNGKKEKQTVVDFDVKVELTPYLYADVRNYKSWRELRTPDNRERTRRGTVFRCQAPEVAGPPQLSDLEQNANNDEEDNDGKPSLEEWCRRYCADPSPLRAFTLERRVVGLDYKKVRTQMEALVRRTNYRGHLQVTFPTDEVGLVYYSDHRFNRWRLLKWVQVLCVLTLMILFTWPFLFFRTKRYEVVTVDWPFSRRTAEGQLEYISLSEDQWYNMWARAITSGVLSKRQGTLDQEDLRRAEGAEPSFESTGNATADGALGFVRAGISAMNHVNRQLGWGGDC